jgi:hypothetical protein
MVFKGLLKKKKTVTEAIWSAENEMFTLWAFSEKVCSLVIFGSEQNNVKM